MTENAISTLSPGLAQAYGDYLSFATEAANSEAALHNVAEFFADAAKLNTEDGNRLLDMMGRQGLGKLSGLLRHGGWTGKGDLDKLEIERMTALTARADKQHLFPAFQRQAQLQGYPQSFGDLAGDDGLKDIVAVVKATRPNTARVLELAAAMSRTANVSKENHSIGFSPSIEDVKEAYDLVNAQPGLHLNLAWVAVHLKGSALTDMASCLTSDGRRALIDALASLTDVPDEKLQDFFKWYSGQTEAYGDEVLERFSGLWNRTAEKLLPVADAFTPAQRGALAASHLLQAVSDHKKYPEAVAWLEGFIAEHGAAAHVFSTLLTDRSTSFALDTYIQLKKPESREAFYAAAEDKLRPEQFEALQALAQSHELATLTTTNGSNVQSSAAKYWGVVVSDRPEGNGVVVVSAKGDARRAGLREGAVITQVGGTEISSAQTFRDEVYSRWPRSYHRGLDLYASENPGGLGGSFNLHHVDR